MRIRQFAAAATLLTVALTTAGCGPDDASGSGSSAATSAKAAPPAASAAPSSAAGSAAPSTAASATGKMIPANEEGVFEKSALDPKGCAEFYNFHQVMSLKVGSDGQLKATKVKSTCTQYGVQLDFAGPETALKIAPGTTIAMFVKATGSKDYPRYTAQRVSLADFAKVRKPCFDIPDPDKRPAGLFCGESLFVYTADGSGTVNTIHETWEPTD